MMTREARPSALAFAVAASTLSPMYAANCGSDTLLVVLVTARVVGALVLGAFACLLLLPHPASTTTTAQAPVTASAAFVRMARHYAFAVRTGVALRPVRAG